MVSHLTQVQQVFFIGIAGSGMTALAQYLKGIGKQVSGSDRYFSDTIPHDTRDKLEAMGITCFAQDGSGISEAVDLVIVSTAVEDTVMEVQRARALGIPILKRSALLALIARSKQTIAVGGTSGKSTTAAMIFDILHHAGRQPSIITGAGLVRIMREGKIGNAQVGAGDWLIIEADESDGSIVEYQSEIGVLLNVDKDHKEIGALQAIFQTFRANAKRFIVNRSHSLARTFSMEAAWDFAAGPGTGAFITASNYTQEGLGITFEVNGVTFRLHAIGHHNMENALAAIAVAVQVGVPLEQAANALQQYEGIYRRHQVLGHHKGVWLIDDFAHNPAKCAASIKACQPLAAKVVAWFQPHGYGPTRFLRHDFVDEIAAALRPQDEIWMSEIYYAGGTAVKDISAADLIKDLQERGRNAFFVDDRADFYQTVKPHLTEDCVLLLMGARDPSLEKFAAKVWEELTAA